MAKIDLGKVGITDGGTWKPNKSFEALTSVLFARADGGDGCSYVSLKDNIDVAPGTDATVWMKSTEAGQSIYELCVAAGTFDGTEEEFIVAYNKAVQDAVDAAAAANDTNTTIQAVEQLRVKAETSRVEAESARTDAESLRVAAELARAQAENNRVAAETVRAKEFSTKSAAMTTAIGLADSATSAANTAADLASTKAGLADEAAKAANDAADAANAAAEAAAEDVTNPFKVFTEHIAALTKRVEELENGQDRLGNAIVDTIEITTALTQVTVGGNPLVIIGTAAPEVIPDFAGQIYIDTSNANIYMAKGNSAVSDFVVLN